MFSESKLITSEKNSINTALFVEITRKLKYERTTGINQTKYDEKLSSRDGMYP